MATHDDQKDSLAAPAQLLSRGGIAANCTDKILSHYAQDFRGPWACLKDSEMHAVVFDAAAVAVTQLRDTALVLSEENERLRLQLEDRALKLSRKRNALIMMADISGSTTFDREKLKAIFDAAEEVYRHDKNARLVLFGDKGLTEIDMSDKNALALARQGGCGMASYKDVAMVVGACGEEKGRHHIVVLGDGMMDGEGTLLKKLAEAPSVRVDIVAMCRPNERASGQMLCQSFIRAWRGADHTNMTLTTENLPRIAITGVDAKETAQTVASLVRLRRMQTLSGTFQAKAAKRTRTRAPAAVNKPAL